MIFNDFWRTTISNKNIYSELLELDCILGISKS